MSGSHVRQRSVIDEDMENDICNEEIVLSLLIEDNNDITEAEVFAVSRACGINPWNAPIVYKLLKETL